jgi:hypothetical protein
MKKLLLIFAIAITGMGNAQAQTPPDVYGILNYSDTTGGIYRDVVNFTWEPIMTWTKARNLTIHSDTVDFTACDTILMNPNALSLTYVRGLEDSLAVLRSLITDPGARMAAFGANETESEYYTVPKWAGSSIAIALLISIGLSLRVLLKKK